MPNVDYTGALGSNAGDDFHELWAVQQSLDLLDANSGLSLVTVEGLRPDDEQGATTYQWSGVDCALYFGGHEAESCSRIVIQQLKYSGAAPHAAWTIARLTKSTGEKVNNSVIRRLADSFAALVTKRKGSAGGIAVRLISNQPVHSEVHEALRPITDQTPQAILTKRKQLQSASGLADGLFVLFASALDVSSQTGSRFEVEDDILRTISAWSDDDLRAIRDSLQLFVRKKMLPEAISRTIDRAAILLQFGFSDPQALFPCPPRLKIVPDPVPRAVADDVVAKMHEGQQYICLHGPPGCGKTTSLQEIMAKIPPGSVMVTFDSYGGGDYLHSNSYRHRTRDAFRQIANQLATQSGLPSFLTQRGEADYPRFFSRRLTLAAEAVALQNPSALVVIAIDAADNSVIAAESMKPAEASFVRDFVALGNLSKNVRLIITARSGRLSQLNLPPHFLTVAISGFERDETSAYVRKTLPAVSDSWVEEFHRYAGGNPRVESYALEYGSGDATKSMSYLLPQGKVLYEIFETRLVEATLKAGASERIDDFCASIVAFPRPIPVKHLATVMGVGVHEASEICLDLSPAIRIEFEEIFLADEDFETFLRDRVKTKLAPLQSRVAEVLFQLHAEDEYAATYVASALYDAGRGKDILSLLKKEALPSSIPDPLIRREVQLQRFRLGMAVATEHSDMADALSTMLYGAEALKTEEAIRDLVINNPDLAAAFMETAYRLILTDPTHVENHGSLLFQFLLQDAMQKDRVLFWRDHAQLTAWLQRRGEEKAKSEGRQNTPWKIDADDIAAEVEAFLISVSVKAAMNMLERWRPRRIGIFVARNLVPKLIFSGRSKSLHECLTAGLVKPPWNLLLLVPLVLSGSTINFEMVEDALDHPLRLGELRSRDVFSSDDSGYFWRNIVLTACEILAGQSRGRESLTRVLRRLSGEEIRRATKLSAFNSSLVDLLLRSYCLNERLSGRIPTLAGFLFIDDVPKSESARQNRNDAEREDKRLIEAILPLYDARARILVEQLDNSTSQEAISGAVGTFKAQRYQIERGPGIILLVKRMAASLATLISHPRIDQTWLTNKCLEFVRDQGDPFGSGELAVFSTLALDQRLHAGALSVIADCATRVKTMRTTASEKIDAMLKFARFLLPLSPLDAKALFGEAHGMTEEMDADSIYQLRAIMSLASVSSSAGQPAERRQLGRTLVPIVTDSAIRLSGLEGFPWERTVSAMARLDVPLSLAAAARWQDTGIASIDTCLPAILETALREKTANLGTAVALLTLIERPPGSLYLAIRESIDEDSVQQKEFLEVLARDELLYFREGSPETPLQIPDETAGPDSPWLKQLRSSLKLTTKPATSTNQIVPESEPKTPTKLLPAPAARRYITPNEIKEAINETSKYPDGERTYVSALDVLKKVRGMVAVGNYVDHLNALCGLPETVIHDYDLSKILIETLNEWNSPAVANWAATRLPHILIQRFVGLTEVIRYESGFSELIKRIPKAKVASLITSGIAAHVGALPASTIYELIALLASYLDSQDVARMLPPYLDRMKSKIPPDDLDEINDGDVPVGTPEGVACFLWALLSDIDVRVRWRTAHAVRRLVRFGESAVFKSLFEQYEKKSLPAYRALNAPFYWLAARLWLIITADRIAADDPEALAGQKGVLFRIVSDSGLPHVLIRAFAKKALLKLAEKKGIDLSAEERGQLEAVNRTTLSKQKVDRYSQPRSRPTRYEERQFHFDGLDTISYWYEPTLRVFASVDMDKFLDVAEKCIVKDWGVSGDIWRWDREPRRGRLSDHQWQMWHHGHGSMPTMERYNTFLEWHAMFCAVGELMLSEPLVDVDEDDYGSFEHWLSHELLSWDPWWLSDLRTAKPLEARFWSVPSNIVEWVDSARDVDFLTEAGITNSAPKDLVAWAYHTSRSREHESRVAVRTALVQPETAAALVRAFQTAEEPLDFGIPTEETERLMIDEAPYRLMGWITHQDGRSGIDEKDPFAHGIGGFGFIPGVEERARLVQFVRDNWPVVWHDTTELTEYRYEQWADKENERNPDYDERLRSSGCRLWVSVERLRSRLAELKCDLLVEVEVTRKKKSRYGRDDSKETVEWRYERIYVFRRDGSIEAAEGRIGTWHSPST
jgi:hypothetical protein